MKRTIVFALVSLSASAANAGFVCDVTCSGTVDRVTDVGITDFKQDHAAFGEACERRGGVVRSGLRDGFGFDQMGCWAPKDGSLHYTYCVVEEKVEAAGFAVTITGEAGGGEFMAGHHAAEACEGNLSRFSCGDKGRIKARDVVFGQRECRKL